MININMKHVTPAPPGEKTVLKEQTHCISHIFFSNKVFFSLHSLREINEFFFSYIRRQQTFSVKGRKAKCVRVCGPSCLCSALVV